MPAWPAATARGVDSGCGRFRTPTHIRKGVGAERPARRRRRDRHRLGGGAQQRDVRMERQRALMAAVAGGLRTQQLGQLQQPARRAAGAEPDHAGARPMAEIVEPHAEAGLHDAAGQFAQRQLFLRGDLAEKRQRQVQISRHYRSAGLRRKRLGAPADHLLLQGIRQGQSENRRRRWTWGLGK